MTILFGRLTQDFVNFTTILSVPSLRNQVPDPFPAAAAAFRSSANKNALYLVLIGQCDIPWEKYDTFTHMIVFDM